MATEHSLIPNEHLHEPKDVALAISKTVYVADGGGSGSWDKVDANTLEGSVSNSTPAGRRVVTNGSGGFSAEQTPASAFGSMNLTNNATVKAVPAAADGSLNTNGDYVEYNITMDFDNIQGMSTGSNYLQVNSSGLYLVDFWANVRSSVNTTKFSLKFVVNGVDFVPRGPKTTLATAEVGGNISANGVHNFSAGDQVKLFIAADKAVNITLEDLTFQMVYLGAFS